VCLGIGATKYGMQAKLHKILVPNLIGMLLAVDKLSNIWKYNFYIFLVDKRYTLVVYLST
jgi:hypothetical protein